MRNPEILKCFSHHLKYKTMCRPEVKKLSSELINLLKDYVLEDFGYL